MRGFACMNHFEWLLSWRMIPSGRTARLVLRPLELGDAPQMQQHFPHWEIVRYLLNRVPWPYPPDGALQYLRDVALPQVESDDARHWSLRLAERPDQLIGVISLVRNPKDNRGFWLGLPWQGHGYMMEASSWANDFWFDTLGFPVMRIPKAAANLPSRRISEKQGMRLVGTEMRDYVSGRMLAEIWELTAEEWRAQRRNAALPDESSRV